MQTSLRDGENLQGVIEKIPPPSGDVVQDVAQAGANHTGNHNPDHNIPDVILIPAAPGNLTLGDEAPNDHSDSDDNAVPADSKLYAKEFKRVNDRVDQDSPPKSASR
jgi:hypothetical protein